MEWYVQLYSVRVGHHSPADLRCRLPGSGISGPVLTPDRLPMIHTTMKHEPPSTTLLFFIYYGVANCRYRSRYRCRCRCRYRSLVLVQYQFAERLPPVAQIKSYDRDFLAAYVRILTQEGILLLPCQPLSVPDLVFAAVTDNVEESAYTPGQPCCARVTVNDNFIVLVSMIQFLPGRLPLQVDSKIPHTPCAMHAPIAWVF